MYHYRYFVAKVTYLATVKLTTYSQTATAADTCVLHVPEHTAELAVLRYVKHESSIALPTTTHVNPQS